MVGGSKEGEQSMSDELRAAAETYLECAKLFEEPSDRFSMDDGIVMLGAGHQLAVAYLAEHPADDDEPLTDESLRAIGFELDKDAPSWAVVIGKKPHRVRITFAGQPCLRIEEMEIKVNPTRGDIRLLCRALGIELKE